ncbi:molecular chaperone DnaJ [Pseudonocardia ailaonensis]|uniref:Chaperone protein DnaJ n=1 Tax=Pseudonocardia ailaonensis TaxID=367279 RepID=A0ABN2NP55_9PSEU
MTQRDWIEKDFYRELGVSSTASDSEIKKAYRKLARELHPDANPDDAKAEARFKSVSEAYGVLGDPEKRKEYDETRKLFAGGGGFTGGGGFPGGFPAGGQGGFSVNDLGDLFGQGSRSGAGGAGGLGDLFGNLFGNRGPAAGTQRAQRGADVESSLTISFDDAVRGSTMTLQLSSPGTCDTCGGSGAKPGTGAHTCPTCSGAGVVSRSQGAFAFSEPCRDCRGTGRVIDEPCPECHGDGVSTKVRSLTVRVPAGVDDGQRIRLAGKGEPGRYGGPAGDLYVKMNVSPHPLFGRSAKDAKDLTLKVPVTFPELVQGATLTVPTLDGTVSLKIPAGTQSGRTFRVRGRGVPAKKGTGDLLVTVEVAIPQRLDDAAATALAGYVDATKSFDPRADLLAGAQVKNG